MPNILNQDTIASLRDLGNDFFKELIETFLQSSQDQIELIRRGVREESGSDIEAAAHNLKGACYSQGAEELSTLCAEMEEKGREDNLSEIDGLLTLMEESYELTTVALREILKDGNQLSVKDGNQ